MSPSSIRLMVTEDLRSSILLYRELQSKSTQDELILAFMENELDKRMNQTSLGLFY
jgi:hypothetical protein